MAYTITETIHHGDFRSERSLFIDNNEQPRAKFGEFLKDSPYVLPDPMLAAKNRFAELRDLGEVNIGWARYTLTRED